MKWGGDNIGKIMWGSSVIGKVYYGSDLVYQKQAPTPVSYIQFADPAVEAICIANWSSDGIGLTLADAARVTSLNRVFTGNTAITSFDEFQYFTSVTTVTAAQSSNTTTGAFYNCTALTSITLPNSITTIGKAAFNGCTSLQSINFPDSLTTISNYAFQNCSSLVFTNLNKIQVVSSYAFKNTGVVSFVAQDIVSTAGTSSNYSGSFCDCANLEYAEFGPDCTTIAQRTFQRSRKFATFVCRAITPPTLGSNAFATNATGRKIYVPYSADHSILDAYKTANLWANIASSIYELNSDGTIPS